VRQQTAKHHLQWIERESGMDGRLTKASTTRMETATAIIIAVAACALIVLGIYLALADRAASAATAWGFGFLLVILLLLTKFKRFKGFGFEAELWEQKQVEAANLIDQLKSLAKLMSKQMAMVAARIGLWDSALSMAELADLVDDLKQQLDAIDVPPHESEEILRTLYQRIESAYCAEAWTIMMTALKAASNAVHSDLSSPIAEDYRRAVSLRPALNKELAAAGTLQSEPIAALVRLVQDSTIITGNADVAQRLMEIERDLQHFRTCRSFRRRDMLPTVAR
jgi:hypothetical protein